MRSFSRFAPFGLILVVCLAPMFARAADVSITCAAPTQFTDGSPIPAGTAFTFHLYSGSTGLDTQTACQFTRKNLAANTYNYSVTATVAGIESDKSEIVQVVVPPPVVPALKPTAPGAPVGTVSPSSPTAFSVIKSQDSLVMLPVGRTNATSCDLTQAVQLGAQTYRPVPASSVTFTGTARPIVIFALCS